MDASRRPAQIDDIPVGNGPGSGLENVFSGKAAAKDSLGRALGEALGIVPREARTEGASCLGVRRIP